MELEGEHSEMTSLPEVSSSSSSEISGEECQIADRHIL